MMYIFIFVPLMLVLHFICGDEPALRRGMIALYNGPETWAEAQTYCRTHHTDLITIREGTLDLPSDYKGWIGLQGVWKWSSGDEVKNVSNFQDSGNSENCVYIHKNNWYTDDCNNKHGFICYNESLVLVKEKKTWEEALEHCRTIKEGRNYTLVTLNTTDDHDFARENAELATTVEVWTGLRDEWVWVGGKPVQHQNILSCPAVRCGVLQKNSNSLFGIRDCNERRNFICYLKS